MLVTVYTDASFYQQHSIGAYAFWARSNVGKIAKSGPFKRAVTSSDQCEMLCMCNAIHCILSSWPDTKTIFINTDSQSCMGMLLNNHKTKDPVLVKAILFIRSKCESAGVEVKLRHVKGHQSKNKSIRHWLNNWCDIEAKKHAKALINQ